MQDEIKDVIADVLGVSVASLTDDLAPGDIPEWDSLRHVMVLTALEKTFNIKFQREELLDVEDLSELVALVEEKAQP